LFVLDSGSSDHQTQKTVFLRQLAERESSFNTKTVYL